MSTNQSLKTAEQGKKTELPRVLIATTAMLAFISFWRAAAIVLNDMGSSAFYAGAIAEHFIGKTAPWFILAIMMPGVRGALGVHRELQHVRARRRLSRGQRGDGQHAGQDSPSRR